MRLDVVGMRQGGWRIQNAWGSRGRRESPPGVIEERCTEAERSAVELTELHKTRNAHDGGMPERPKGADCKSAGLRLRRFESFSLHQLRDRDEEPAGIAQL